MSRVVLRWWSLWLWVPALGVLLEQRANGVRDLAPPAVRHGDVDQDPVDIPGRLLSLLQPRREDGRQELFRAAFIRLSIDAKRLHRLALGALNCRVTERQA